MSKIYDNFSIHHPRISTLTPYSQNVNKLSLLLHASLPMLVLSYKREFKTLYVPSNFFQQQGRIYTSLVRSKCMYGGCMEDDMVHGGTWRTYIYVLGTQRVNRSILPSRLLKGIWNSGQLDNVKRTINVNTTKKVLVY